MRVPVTRHYSTCCHARQVPVLFASMLRHCQPFVLHVLAWDYDPADIGFATVAEGGYVTTRADFIARHPEMAPERLPGPPRRPVDVVATVRWTWLADLLTELGEPVTMVDGDIFLMASPEPVFEEIGYAKMAVTPHRIPPRAAGKPGVVHETHWVYSDYNAGWTYFADVAPARELAELCREWSYTEVVTRPNRRPLFGDQAHLADVADKYRAHVIQAPVNIGPWSVHGAPLARGIYSDAVFYGGRELVSYHFSSMRLAPDGTVQQYANACYEVERAPGAVELIYEPYLAAIRKESR